MLESIDVKAHIVGTSSAFPGRYYSQEALADTICAFLDKHGLEFPADTVRSLFTNVQIDGRHFQFPVENFCSPGKMGQTVAQAIDASLDLAETNVRKVLADAGLKPSDIAQMVSVTLTPAVPGIDARLMNRIAFSHDMKRMPLSGVGCMGGVAGINRAADYLHGHPDDALVLISCELSSGLWQGSVQSDLFNMIRGLKQDPSLHPDAVMTIVTAALFGDGSGALLMVGRDHPLAADAPISVFANRSNWIPDSEHIMGMEYIENGIRNILRPEVKTYIGAGLKQVIEPLLAQCKMTVSDIGSWTLHPGGPKIIDAAEAAFGLPAECFQASRDALRKIGNISSATVLYMLDETLKNHRPPPGTAGLIAAMGPGFSQEAALIGWR